MAATIVCTEVDLPCRLCGEEVRVQVPNLLLRGEYRPTACCYRCLSEQLNRELEWAWKRFNTHTENGGA